MSTKISPMPTDFSLEFKRVQFPERHAFGMTINKSQSQSLEVCGIKLELPCFRIGSWVLKSQETIGTVYSPERKIKNIGHRKDYNSYEVFNCN